MNKKKPYKVFFAIPFDAAMQSIYDSIIHDLEGNRKRSGQQFQFTYGASTVVEPSGDYSKIEEFKAQNRDLLKRFYAQIRSSDIIVADLTNNNPNVHLELGIAIALNKNILRVSGRDLGEVGSDIRGHEVNRYRKAKDLRTKIENYLAHFLLIKELPLNESASPHFKVDFPDWEEFGPENRIESSSSTLDQSHIISRLRDGEITVRFKFLWNTREDNWFGVFLRSVAENPWVNGGYLVLVRKDGWLDLIELPNRRLLRRREYSALEVDREYSLHTKIDGSNLSASLDDDAMDWLEDETLDLQSPGDVLLGCAGCRVAFTKAQVVCRDTINVLSDMLWNYRSPPTSHEWLFQKIAMNTKTEPPSRPPSRHRINRTATHTQNRLKPIAR